MSKRSVFTTITPLPGHITRETVLETFHNHVEMIDLNPLVEERHVIKPPRHASAEEYHCTWYEILDKVHYLPGGSVSGHVSYSACFNDLPTGLQTHCYAPLGVDIRAKWQICGSLPGEPAEPVELGIGAPLQGLYIREDVDMRCNIFMLSFVKKTLKKAHETLKARLLVKTQLMEAVVHNERLSEQGGGPLSPPLPSPLASSSYSDRASIRSSSPSIRSQQGWSSRVSYQDLMRQHNGAPKTSPAFPPAEYLESSVVTQKYNYYDERPQYVPVELQAYRSPAASEKTTISHPASLVPNPLRVSSQQPSPPMSPPAELEGCYPMHQRQY